MRVTRKKRIVLIIMMITFGVMRAFILTAVVLVIAVARNEKLAVVLIILIKNINEVAQGSIKIYITSLIIYNIINKLHQSILTEKINKIKKIIFILL